MGKNPGEHRGAGWGAGWIDDATIKQLKRQYPNIEFLVTEPRWFMAQKEDRAEFPSSRVYFIAAAQRAIKIGISDTPEERLTHLQTAHFEPLMLLGTMPGHQRTEWHLHREFAAERLRGEWFRPSSRLLSFIRENRLQDHACKPGPGAPRPFLAAERPMP